MAKYSKVDKKRMVDRVLNGEKATVVAREYGTTTKSIRNWTEELYGDDKPDKKKVEKKKTTKDEPIKQKNINKGNPTVKKILDINDERFANELHNGIEKIPLDLKQEYQEIRELFAELFTKWSANMERYYVFTWRDVVTLAKDPRVDERMARFILSDPQVSTALTDEYREELKQQVDSMTYRIAEGDVASVDIQALKQIATILESTQKYESNDSQIVMVQIPPENFVVSYDNMLNTIGKVYRWAERNDVPQIVGAIEQLKDDEYIKMNKLMYEVKFGDKEEPYVGHAGDLETIWETGDIERE